MSKGKNKIDFIVTDDIRKKLFLYSRENKSTGCIEWLRARSAYGYGEIKIQGRKYNTHRVAYYVTYGKFDHTLLVCHKCDNPACINPLHLFLGTTSDNMLDCSKKNRLFVARGESNSFAKLTNKQADWIRKNYKAYSKTYGEKALAQKFGVNRKCIRRILIGKSYTPK